ncbi:MAG: DUF5671 domain-containing protein [Acidimicrobiia bacterium]
MAFFALLPLLVLLGIVVLIVRAIDGRDRTTADGEGIAARRMFRYLMMLLTLVLSCVGLAGLVDAAATSAQQITTDTAAVALSIAFVVVAAPAFIVLAMFTRRRLRDDPAEVRSPGWALYLTLVLFGSLVTTVTLLITLVGDLLVGDGLDRTALVNVVIWGTVWAVHWWVAEREGYEPNLRIEHLMGSFVGLVVLLSAGTVAAANVLVELYDTVVDIAPIGPTAEQIVRPLAACAVGAVVWGWYWLRTTVHDERSGLWNAYVLLAGVLSGVLLVVAGVGTAVFRVLEWLLADPSGTATEHFEVVPAALGVVAAGVAAWAYHRHVLDGGTERDRTEVDRVYDYLLSGAGLVVAAGGLATLLTYALWAIAGTEITGSDRSVIAVALTLLAVGGPLWGIYWSRAQRERVRQGVDEAQSTTRRTYLFIVLGVSGLVALVNLIVLVYLIVQAILDGTGVAEVLDAVAVPISLLATAGAVAWYHFTVVRHDRSETPKVVRPTVREVILVTAAGQEMASALEAADIRVRRFHAAAPPIDVDSIGDVLSALGTEGHQHVVIVDRAEGRGFEVIPLE